MSGIRFEADRSRVSVRNPLNGFALEVQEVEVRRDPLLGDTSILNRFQMENKAGFSGVNDRAFIAQLAERSAASCVFCPERLEERTARYPDALVPGGHLRRGEATLLPNLFALGAFHPVVVLSRAHFLEPAQFGASLLADGIGAAAEFVRLAHGRDAGAAFTVLGANYLPPAGASQIHPHLQLLTTPLPYTRHERLLAACRAHQERHGASGLLELANEEERRGERFAGRTGGWRWLAAYAPQGSNEVLAVHDSAQDLAALPGAEVLALADGVSRVLAFYGDRGLLSFNWILHSVRGELPAPGFRLCLRVVSRQNLSPGYRNDDYFLQKLLDTDVAVTPPEDLADQLRGRF